MMNAQVVFDEDPAVSRKLKHDLCQQLHMAGGIAAWASENCCLAGSWLEATMHPDFTPATIVGFEGRTVSTLLPLSTRIGLGRKGSQLINADYPRARWWHHITLSDSTIWTWMAEAGFAWKRQQRWFPDTAKHDPAFAEKRGPSSSGTAYRSFKARCSRSRVHSANGYPNVCGFWSARRINWLRAVVNQPERCRFRIDIHTGNNANARNDPVRIAAVL